MPGPKRVAHAAGATIKAGHSAVVRVRLQVTQVGTVRNIAVTGSGATETRLRDNLAVARAVWEAANKQLFS